MSKQLSVTIGIPTYVGGPSLVNAVKSIRQSKGAEAARLIVTVDANPLTQDVTKALTAMGVEIIENKARGGQVVRLKQLIAMTKTDLLITTQDDIRFESDTVQKIIDKFMSDQTITMVGARVLPDTATTLHEQVVEVGVKLTLSIGGSWNSGDNYLMASGRCLAFNTQFIQKFSIPDTMINSDAFFYFENRRLGGKFAHLPTAIVYNKSAQKIDEHLKQSKKFQLSYDELSHLLDIDFDKDYKVPTGIKVAETAKMLLKNPVFTLLYLLLSVYTRYLGKQIFKPGQRYWDTDQSTKRV